MTALELHISLQQQLNNVDAYMYDNYLEQEADNYLNLAQEEYIKLHYSSEGNKYKRGFEQSQKRIDDLRELVVKYYADNAFTTEESNLYRFTLPSDYMFLVNQRSKVYYNVCDGDITVSRVNIVEDEYIAVLPFTPSNYILEGYSADQLDIRVNGSSESIVWATPPLTLEDYFNPKDNLALIDLLLESNRTYSSNYRLYWENYKGIYRKGSFIVVYIGTGLVVSDVTIGKDPSYDTATFTNDYESYYKIGVTGGGYETVLNKYVQADDIYALMIDPHNTTQPTRPLTVIHSNYIDVFATQKFIVTEVIISYIRTPKKISLALNQTSELAPHTHSEIVALAVNTILENTKSDRTQTNQQELLKSE